MFMIILILTSFISIEKFFSQKRRCKSIFEYGRMYLPQRRGTMAKEKRKKGKLTGILRMPKGSDKILHFTVLVLVLFGP